MNLKNLVLISATVLVVAIIFEIFLFISGSKILTERIGSVTWGIFRSRQFCADIR